MDWYLLIYVNLLWKVHDWLLSGIIWNYITRALVTKCQILWLEIQNLGFLNHRFFNYSTLLGLNDRQA